jgi:hypothetical protein
MSERIDDLAAADLAAVTFVRGYLQFQFETAGESWMLNVYTPPYVVGPGGQKVPGATGYRHALLDLVNATVRDAGAGKDELAIVFDDARSLRISLRTEDQEGPEAAMLAGQLSNRWYVW